jgi:microcystin degradation protein MlrC
MRIATGGISHETSTFTTVPTTIASAEDRQGYQRGQEMLDKYRGANTPIGGFIEGAEAHGFELVPTTFWEAHPSAPLPRADFDSILSHLISGIEATGDIDGVLLELHGAMVAEGIPDGEGHILSAVRDLVGPTIPIVAQLDIHSNVSALMIEKADALAGRETYPEVDMAERGRECADILVRIVREGLRPTMALHQIPLVWGMNQVTAHQPMRDAIKYLHEVESRPGIVSASIATCYPLADVPDMGASVYVVSDDDTELAQACANELGQWIFERREEWQLHRPSTAEAIELAESEQNYPVIFADRDDNTGGGSPGDSTGMLRAFIDAGLRDACVLYIVDPEAVQACHNAGVGTKLNLDVGAKSTSLQGSPVHMDVEVLAVSDGTFHYDGPMYAGLEGYMGPSAHIVQDGIHVLLVNGREQPFCTAFARSLDLDPKQMRYIGVKSAAHFRAGFESWAGAIHVVAEPSVHNPADGKLAFKNLGRKLYPFDEI